MHDSDAILIRLTSNSNGRSWYLLWVYRVTPSFELRECNFNTGCESGFPERNPLNIEEKLGISERQLQHKSIMSKRSVCQCTRIETLG